MDSDSGVRGYGKSNFSLFLVCFFNLSSSNYLSMNLTLSMDREKDVDLPTHEFIRSRRVEDRAL